MRRDTTQFRLRRPLRAPLILLAGLLLGWPLAWRFPTRPGELINGHPDAIGDWTCWLIAGFIGCFAAYLVGLAAHYWGALRHYDKSLASDNSAPEAQ